MRARLSRLLVSAMLAGGVAMSTPPAHAGSLDELFVFGDSLSDSGNLYALTGGAFPPSPPYAQRVSNGPVAVEYLAAHFGIALMPSLAGGTNYAVAGAETGTGSFLDIPNTGVLAQISAFAASGTVFNPDTSLFVVWAGPNDFFSLLDTSPMPDPATVAATIFTAVGNLQDAVLQLAGLGAMQILIPDMALLGNTPFGASLGPDAVAALNALSFAFNLALEGMVDFLDPLLAADLIFVPVSELLSQAIADPGAFGFSNVTDACLSVLACALDPQLQDEFLFWDDVHPTTRAHRIIGALFTSQVPEPATLLLLAAALALLFAHYRSAGS